MCRYSKVDASRVCGHKEWAPTRKIDPITLSMSEFRRAVHSLLVGGVIPTPIPTQEWPVINRPPVAIMSLPGVRGYAIVSDDGGVFNFGEFPFLGSLGHLVLSAPIVSAEAVVVGGAPGYRMLGRDGAVYTFGSATYEGRVEYRLLAGVRRLLAPVRKKVDPMEFADGCPGDDR